MLTLNEKHKSILSTCGHMLITGGPGSGKTTISILKAAQIVEDNIMPVQNVLFLSFARATVARVIEAIEQEHKLLKEIRKQIQVETYHAFFWQILKTHGYLVGLPRKLSILLPHDEAIALASIRNDYGRKMSIAEKKEKSYRETEEKRKLALNEGRVCFDLFADYASQILHGSKRVRQLISKMFPYIILDEFQDTNAPQWCVIKAICENSEVIALADPEQRIYDFIGADPERLNHFCQYCHPKTFDLGTDNHRSQNTDIRMFGDDVLTGHFRKRLDNYVGIECNTYPCNKNQAFSKIKSCTLQAYKRLVESENTNWSIAILTPTKALMRQVSFAFQSSKSLPEIYHSAAIDIEGTSLATELIGHLMQPNTEEHMSRFIDLLCRFYRGKGGGTPTKGALREAEKIEKDYFSYKMGKKLKSNSTILRTLDVYIKVQKLVYTGNPYEDWKNIRLILSQGQCTRLQEVNEELKNVRLLRIGTALRQSLSQDWRDNGCYARATDIIHQAFVQEHFTSGHRPETGVIVMNMHKAKGKQFDEVIIFEGWPRCVNGSIVGNPGRIILGNMHDNASANAKQNFRVSITRGKKKVTILTPRCDPCILLNYS